MFGLAISSPGWRSDFEQKREIGENLIHWIKPSRLSKTTAYCVYFLSGALRKVLGYTTPDPMSGYLCSDWWYPSPDWRSDFQKHEIGEKLIHRIKPSRPSETTAYCAHVLSGALRKVLGYRTPDPMGGYVRAGDILHKLKVRCWVKTQNRRKPDPPQKDFQTFGNHIILLVWCPKKGFGVYNTGLVGLRGKTCRCFFEPKRIHAFR